MAATPAPVRRVACIGAGTIGASWTAYFLSRGLEVVVSDPARKAADLVRRMDAAGKPLGIICHGGLIAISAGIVKGHRATGSLGIKDDLLNAGATWADEAALRDGNQVWGRVVADIPAFCRELVALMTSAA